MNAYQQMLKAKRCSVEDALAAVQGGDFIGTSGGCNVPFQFFKELHTIVPRIKEQVTVFYGCTSPKGTFEFLSHPRYQETFKTLSGFVLSNAEREMIAEGYIDYVPTHYHHQGFKLKERSGVDVYIAAVCPMDERTGYFRTSLANVNEADFRDHAKKIYLEVVPSMPVVYGNNEIHISEVAGVYEHDHPIDTMDPLPFGDLERTIGQYVADLIEDGSTIQLGIGAVPDAVAHAFMDKKDLGVHTEMITNSIYDLVQAGVITGKRKSLHRGIIIGAFSRGSQKLYDFLANNPQVAMHPCRYVNDPYTIAQNYKMCSINTAMGVDLFGQVSSESIGTRHYSGTGGQVDTATGAVHSPGGKSVIALASTAKGGTLSKISPIHPPGTVTTLSRVDVDYVVTEYGVARLRGTSMRERAKLLIGIAHPDFRDELTHEARKMNLM